MDLQAPGVVQVHVKTPKTMGSRPLNFFRDSSNTVEWFIVKRGMYALTSRVRVCPVTISHLSTFGPWKHMDLIPHPLGHFLVTTHTTACATPELYGRAT